MNNTDQEIFDLIQKLESVLLQLDKEGHSLPAIKVEEAILALTQTSKRTKNSDDLS